MIIISISTVENGRLVKAKVSTKYEKDTISYYGSDWSEIIKVKRQDGISYIEILQFDKAIRKEA